MKLKLLRLGKKKVSEQISDFLDRGLSLLNIQLKKWLRTGADLEPKDFKLIADSILGLHRVKRLEDGEPTQITSYEAMSPEELMQYLKSVYTEIKSKHSDLIEYSQPLLPEPALTMDVTTKPLEEFIKPHEPFAKS